MTNLSSNQPSFIPQPVPLIHQLAVLHFLSFFFITHSAIHSFTSRSIYPSFISPLPPLSSLTIPPYYSSTLQPFNLSTFQPFNPSNPAHSNQPTFEFPFDASLAIQIAFFNLPSICFAAYPIPLLNSPSPSCLSNTFHPLLQSIFTHHSISHFSPF